MMYFTKDEIVAIVSGLVGASVYVYKQEKHATLLEKLTALLLGAAMAWICTPILAWRTGLTNAPGALGAIGLIVGAFSMEVFELVISVLDEIQKDPKFIVNFIRKRFDSNEKEKVQKGKQGEGNEDESEES